MKNYIVLMIIIVLIANNKQVPKFLRVSDDIINNIKQEFEESVKPITEQQNFGVWQGWYSSKTQGQGAVGQADIDQKTAASPENVIPSGSVTKAMTAAVVLRHQEAGKFKLSDKAYTQIDPWLTKQGQKTLTQIYGPTVQKVTIKMLLGMRSGLKDYDNNYIWDKTLANAAYGVNVDNRVKYISPFDQLNMVGESAYQKEFWCEPGECGAQSSIGQMYLGFLVCAVEDIPWQQYDVSKYVPGIFGKSKFGVPDKLCSGQPNVPHLQGLNVANKQSYPIPRSDQSNFYDTCCLNGWSFGYAIPHALEASKFFQLLLSNDKDKLISSETQALMQTQQKFTKQFAPGLEQGLGLIQTQLGTDMWWGNCCVGENKGNIPQVKGPDAQTVKKYSQGAGHDGLDQGSGGHFVQYPGLDIAMTLVFNKETQILPPNNNQNVLDQVWCIQMNILQKQLAPSNVSFNCPGM